MEDLYRNLNLMSRLDLSTYPMDEITRLFTTFGEVGMVIQTLHPGKSIIRARPNSDSHEVFTNRSQLSYKPEKFNTTFQRASTPNKSMFYGCVVPEQLSPSDFEYARVTAFTEVSNTYRKNPFHSEEKITYSRWEVIKDINLVMVIFNDRFKREGSVIKSLNEKFNKFLEITNPELVKRTMVVNEFLSDQFANPNIRFDYDYLISALYTELVIKRGYDGIYYPSVRADGRGYNICITPQCADSNVKLVAAGESMIYKLGKRTILTNLSNVKVGDDSKDFKYESIEDPKINIPKDEILRELNK